MAEATTLCIGVTRTYSRQEGRAKNDHVLMPFCAPAGPVGTVGPASPVPHAPVLGSGLDPPVLPACSAPHDEPSGEPLWLVSGTGSDKQGSKIPQHTAATGFSRPCFDIM